jgi:hypothetical protein
LVPIKLIQDPVPSLRIAEFYPALQRFSPVPLLQNPSLLNSEKANRTEKYVHKKKSRINFPPTDPILPNFEIRAPLYVEGPMGRWIVSSRR